MGNRLEGKVAIVTGGGSGIGEAISKKFAKERAKVVVAGFPEDPVEDVVKGIQQEGGTATAFTGDLSVLANAQRCVDLAVKEYGKLDILINNAGTFPETNMLSDYTEEAFDYLLKNNVRTVFCMSKAALPELQKTKGNIVTAGSESGVLGIAKNAPYGGTKGFNHAFTKGLAAEQAQTGVRCNIVAPGPIDTGWTHKETGPMDEKMEKMVTQGTLMGRRGTPEEVANVYLFLASDEASYVTGAVWPVDGGTLIAKGPAGKQAAESMKQQPEQDLNLEHSKDSHTSVRSQDK
ncbi:NAD(P)-dependent dehydrogenase (short-subunit alcohol dehydrogenase family) [Pontibacter ummariensis]|uniref:NAD(P)-dependent dehydrogenase, short-chain alcohol dehydrogenase family n=1 Tax=Pontibacter ummariensis TaxID=1610492 RepID=A0A239B3U7_9BACT|nr:SDR family oxidoreductase [Pontibacter ummariensis]PRY16268.1 NAD(P)-dependent dehydrogenase (short-subunit alcohol dehydrogenase family) [Pontibacter ummariensis]SNS02212.1 NAD(P)-dependent dehydrogenase, short-chain alcohol dehydrogenase family [Pontibacter ummariensis]